MLQYHNCGGCFVIKFHLIPLISGQKVKKKFGENFFTPYRGHKDSEYGRPPAATGHRRDPRHARCAAQGHEHEHERGAHATMPGHLFKRPAGRGRAAARATQVHVTPTAYPRAFPPLRCAPCRRRRRGLAACGMRMGNTRRISRALVLL